MRHACSSSSGAPRERRRRATTIWIERHRLRAPGALALRRVRERLHGRRRGDGRDARARVDLADEARRLPDAPRRRARRPRPPRRRDEALRSVDAAPRRRDLPRRNRARSRGRTIDPRAPARRTRRPTRAAGTGAGTGTGGPEDVLLFEDRERGSSSPASAASSARPTGASRSGCRSRPRTSRRCRSAGSSASSKSP